MSNHYQCPNCGSSDLFTRLRCAWNDQRIEWEPDEEPEYDQEIGCQDCMHTFMFEDIDD